jgi:hypothetical protein
MRESILIHSTAMSFLIKGSTLRAQVKWLTRERKLDAVLQRVPPTTAELIHNPPLASTWIDARYVEPILSSLEAAEGTAAVLRMAREKMRDELLPPLRSMLTGVLRLFGATPATLYRRMNDLVKTSAQGMEFSYTASSEQSGVMEVRYLVEREVPSCTFVACMAALEAPFELCGVEGTVSDPERTGPTSARFRITWRSIQA